MHSNLKTIEELRWQKIPVLSDGFVCLVDAMGADEDIVQAARVSYNGHNKSEYDRLLTQLKKLYKECPDPDNVGAYTPNQVRDAMEEIKNAENKLLRMLMRHRHCYTPDMEVLTSRGWIKWSDCANTEEFLVPDPVTRTLKRETLGVEQFDYCDTLVNYENDRMSFSVTYDHKMWFKERCENEFGLYYAIDMKKWGHFDPLRGYILAPEASDALDAEMQFVGFYLGDGSFASTNRITFHLRKVRKQQYLETLITKLGLFCTMRISSTYDDAYVYTIETPDFLKELLQSNLQARSHEKGFNLRSVTDFTRSQRLGMLDGLENSDGSDKIDRDQLTFSTTSGILRKLFELLNAMNGVDAHSSYSDAYKTLVTTSYPADRTTLEARPQYFSEDYRCCKVYCTTTSTGLLMVRGGPDKFAFVCGNSTPFEQCELKFLLRVPMDAWRQGVRHRTFCLAGDVELHFDLPGGIIRRTTDNQPGTQLYKLTVKDVFDRFQPSNDIGGVDFKRERVQGMQLRCLNEDTNEPTHTQIVDIWESGVKPIYEIITECGANIRCSIDHLFLTDTGWKPVRDFDKHTKLAMIAPLSGTGVETSVIAVDESTEAWTDIPGWVGYYEVSTQGRVRRITGGRGSRSFGRCKENTLAGGRYVVSLNRPGVQEVRQVHRLVALAFLGDPEIGQQALHKDGNCLNNNVENLYWGTPQENCDDRIRDGATCYLGKKFGKILKLALVGEEMTYDIEVAGPHHNFSACGLIVHNSINEYSTRYTEAIDSRDETPADGWRLQATNNKQGSSGSLTDWPDGFIEEPEGFMGGEEVSPGEYLSAKEADFHKQAQEIYQERLAFGIAKEQARKDLPLSTYTELYWKGNLHNIFHFLGLRMDSHAQLEIRLYANAIGSIVEKLFPVAYQAFLDYRFNAMNLTALDQAVISLVAREVFRPSEERFNMIMDELLSDKREQDECREKCRKLNLFYSNTRG